MRYTCIKWLCITNEPGANFSWWKAPPNRPLSIKEGVAAVRKAVARRGMSPPLSGPDSTGGLPESVPDKYGFLPCWERMTFTEYSADFDSRTKGHNARQVKNASVWAQHAHGEGKPLFLSEYGTMAYGWMPDKPGPGSPPSVLAGSEYVIRMANMGVDGFNRWSFLNRGDLDGQRQLVDTWDRVKKKLLEDYPPHPNSYFCLGLSSRFAAKNAAVLASAVGEARVDGRQRLFAAAFRGSKGSLTTAVVNDAPVSFAMKRSLAGAAPAGAFYRYRYAEAEAEQERADVKLNPTPIRVNGGWEDELPSNSLTIYSTYQAASRGGGRHRGMTMKPA